MEHEGLVHRVHDIHSWQEKWRVPGRPKKYAICKSRWQTACGVRVDTYPPKSNQPLTCLECISEKKHTLEKSTGRIHR